jgi:hypothetical protein
MFFNMTFYVLIFIVFL